MAASQFTQLSFDAGSVFTPGSPINERDLFAGRIDQIKKIIDAISQRGYHAVLYGERGVGKTSLSNVLQDFLADVAHSFLLPRVNCDASDTFSSIWRKALNDVVVSKSKPGIGFNAEEIESAHRIVDTMPDEISPDTVRHVLSLLSKGVVLVIVFDEFDRIKDKSIPILMADTIKTLSDHSVDATILIIGVADSVDELIQEHHSVERALWQIPMPRMAPDEIKEIVINGLGRLSLAIDGEALEEIVSLSQGIPYITHLLSLHSVRAALKGESSTLRVHDVQEGIEESLNQWQQSIKSSYYTATKSQQPGNIYKEVLLACALSVTDDLGYFTAASVRNPVRLITGRQYDIPNFAKHLKEFSEPVRGGILQRIGEKRRLRYRFVSPIMRPYVTMRGFIDGLLTKRIMDELQRSSGEASQ